MPAVYKRCGCKRCRRGLHSTNGSDYMRAIVRRFRRATKQAIKRCVEPDRLAAVGYTD